MKMEQSLIQPGGIVGILGSGQLGRMLALAARTLGYGVQVFSPEKSSPAGAVADREHIAEYTDAEALKAFARKVDVVTFEFENVPASATAVLEECLPVHPAGRVLHVTQNRLREKDFLHEAGFPVTPYRSVRSREELELAVDRCGLPGILKTADFGYDGKGQVRITAHAELGKAWESMQGAQGVYEAFVPFEKELSVVAVRRANGEARVFPVFENEHAHHILDVTFAPAAVSEAVAQQARKLALDIVDSLDVVGVLTVELFLREEGLLLINELAPRVHNSGHLTLDACVTSQFEQQVRAVCGLPLGDCTMQTPAAAMANLLGDLWESHPPLWERAMQDQGLKLHLYGKKSPRKGRKMGHLTACDQSTDTAVHRVRAARQRLLKS